MTNAYIYDGGRTAFGRHGGALSSLRPDDMLAHVIKTLINRNNFDLKDYEDVIAGCTNQAGEDSRNVARFAGLLSGLPMETGGITLNRLCGSSLASVADAARCVKVGEGELFVACGVEAMSRAPLVLSKAQSAFDRQQTIADTTMGARFSNPKHLEQFGAHSMPETADNIAHDLGITREESDAFALASQLKYEAARKDGYYNDEIIPIPVYMGRKKGEVIISEDEHPRPNSDIASLQKLRALFADGVVTAGNASGINDGASAVLIGSQAIGEKSGVKPRARIVSSAIVGVPPRVMGLGPVGATQKALARAGLTLNDLDVMEFNEAFATQALGCLNQLGLSYNDPRINPNGGAIAIGHPLGASGARILWAAVRQLERTNGRYGLATMCIGIGQGIAVVVERV
ncbi:MAG: 3-oxoadipyl-CoA thiolase [Terasakiella sp.]|uniref:3-oxoadipyl-CoA thiolase n=1 Tax=unclassified Terasakiella TaxID=2614952 RepID=UPI003B001223